jgi:tetratricopeptide (TPR) repeat protein
MKRWIMQGVVWCWIMAVPLHAHGDMHARIEALTREISKHPDDAALYLRRGQLHQQHEEFAAAEADYVEAETRRADSAALQLARGQLQLAQGNAASACAHFDRFLQQEPTHVEARLARAAARVHLKAFADAVDDFNAALKVAPTPEPEWFIDRAHALAAISPPRYEEALKGLDDGLARLGTGVVTLVLAAVDLEIKAGRVDQALARLDRAASAAARQESWVLRRGDVLAQAGRSTAAKQAYEHVLELIAALPPRQRRTRATTDMEERARQALAILTALGPGR